MPIYEYQCQSCGHQFDEIQKFSDDPLKTCPKCNQDALSKLVSATSFKLTGSGWYETDFKNKGKPPAAKDNKGSDDNGQSGGETTSSSKDNNKADS